MAIHTYPLTMPTSPGFTKSKWSLSRKVAVATSPFTGAQQTHEYDYALWTAMVSLPPMKREVAAQWQAFFLKLHGRAGTFLLGDTDAKAPRGAITGNVTLGADVVVGSHEIELATSANSIVNIFRAGDYIQIDSGGSAKLHMIVEDADSNATGGVTVEVEPPIKVARALGTTVTYNNPQGLFRMDTSDMGWDADHVSRYGMTFSCTEAV